MKGKTSFKIIFILGALILGAGFNLSKIPVAQAAVNLSGRILLQVQDKGQAWYVDPISGDRYYLGRPTDAFTLMRRLGLGVSNGDFNSFQNQGVPVRLWGRILLQAQDKGQAWYVDPLDGRLYYLGRPNDAFSLMRKKGLGITDHNLADIPISATSSSQPVSVPELITATSTISGIDPVRPVLGDIIGHWLFKYQDKNYEIFQNLSSALYQAYASSTKAYTYNASNPPADFRNAFYGIFFQTKPGDVSLDDLTAKLKAIATKNNWTSDQLVEFTMALVQYIPYDQAKLSPGDNRNTDPYYPYETLYLDRGVCSDKTFLAVSLLRRLGYGAAILDFPDINHSAVGIQCPVAESINGSGYCYGETTNYFPLGVIPQNISSSGQVQPSTDNQFSNLFNSADLGTIEIYQKTTGQVYQGVSATRQKVDQLAAFQNTVDSERQSINKLQIQLNSQESDLNALKAKMDTYYQNGQISQYNALVDNYNSLVAKFNTALANYQSQVKAYNINVANLNQNINNFYQK